MMGINANAIKCEVNKNVEKMNTDEYSIWSGVHFMRDAMETMGKSRPVSSCHIFAAVESESESLSFV